MTSHAFDVVAPQPDQGVRAGTIENPQRADEQRVPKDAVYAAPGELQDLPRAR